MDWNRVEGNWKQMKGKAKEQWGKLTNDDLDRIEGKRDQLEGKLQERYGYEKDQPRRDVDDWYCRQTWYPISPASTGLCAI
ncbi:CsbD family protein [Pseudorhizobium halotolerans]|uniref:CsbD family protein n=1 Tax=Pseudorhizobium halotolerans TaxID=1233081 RepID=A0ABM8PLD8_9HYPH|nr:CsbD family protein [Pseudorhizobium halotolerans]CAD7036193.1 CsbD family protein [Pseudorhizobium halotolerans]